MSAAGSAGPLREADVEAAAEAVSRRGAYWYTLRNLYYQMIRFGTWPRPANDPLGDVQRFEAALLEYENAHGALPMRIVDTQNLPEPDLISVHPDLVDYIVRRIIIFDRPEPFMVFALNGFHRKIEVGLVVWPGYPKHVWTMIQQRLIDGPDTTIYFLHDCDSTGYALEQNVRKTIKGFGVRHKVVDVGLTFNHAYKLGATVWRQSQSAFNEAGGAAVGSVAAGDLEEAKLLLSAGNFAHLEELPPLGMLRWAYNRITKRPQDIGFG